MKRHTCPKCRTEHDWAELATEKVEHFPADEVGPAMSIVWKRCTQCGNALVREGGDR